MYRHRALFVINTSLSLSIFLFLLLITSTRAMAQTPTLDSEEQAFLTILNNYRAQHGAGPLQASIALTNSAKWMSNDMAQKGYISHYDSLGRDPFTRMAAFGYGYQTYKGENIAVGSTTGQGAFDQWRTACDPDASGNCTYAHNLNMLNPKYKVIGIGRSSTSHSYWTTDFGAQVDATLDSPPALTPTVTIANAASFNNTVAPDALASIFGSNLATGTFMATSLPLPTNLGGTTVTINSVAAQLLYVSPTQINFVVPSGTSVGTASVIVTTNGVTKGSGAAAVSQVSPSFFTVSSNGQGVPAGSTTNDGVYYYPVFNPDGTARSLSVGTSTAPTYLVLFGTGFRRRSSLSNVQMTIGGVAVTAEYVGAQPDFIGLDQLNVKLPISLRGRGTVDLVMTIDGQVANTVKINIGN